jgi:hypothetical protein
MTLSRSVRDGAVSLIVPRLYIGQEKQLETAIGLEPMTC